MIARWCAPACPLVCLIACLVGCSSPPLPSSEEALTSGDAGAREAFIIAEVARGRRVHLAVMIDSLESGDAGERMIALRSLERLTGTTLGYHYADPPARRKQAAAAWREALANGQLTANTSPSVIGSPGGAEH